MKGRACSIAGTGLLLLGLWGALAGPLAAQQEVPPLPVWQVIDDRNAAKDFDGAYALLAPLAGEYGSDAPYLWRLARHHFNTSDNTVDAGVVERELRLGFEYAEQALAADSTSGPAHGYYAILIGRLGEIAGTKQKIINSYAVRDHTLKAVALDPDTDTWQHVMGQWHYKLADLSWFERTIASVVYATPPRASFEEAEEFFARALELEPEEIRHALWLGKSQLALDKDRAARGNLERAVSLPMKSESDAVLQAEARDLLEDLD